MNCVTIDSGTTNTRARVWCDAQVVGQAFVEAGVRDTAISGSKHKLQQGVKAAIDQALHMAGIQQEVVSAFIASGMITSNLGLYEVPHVKAPAGVKELAAGMVAAVIPEVNEKPIWFVPGIKNGVADITLDNCETMDIMRGEEVETFGLMNRLRLSGPAIFVSPGSHSKFVAVDEANQVTGCITTLAGELLGVITNNTIISAAVDHSLVSELDQQLLLKGAACAEKVGLNRACFTVRILDQFGSYSVDQKASFLLGAIIATDVIALRNSSALKIDASNPILVMGKKELRDAFHIVLKNNSFFKGKVTAVSDEMLADIAGFGAMVIARERGIIC